MTKWLVPGLVAVVSLLVTGDLRAQQPGASAHSLSADAWALQFAIGENLNLGEFAGGVISAKHQREEGRMWRYGLSFSAGHTARRADAADRTDAMVGLAAHVLRYPTLARDPGSDLHMFWGIGPLVRLQTQRISPPDGDDISSHLLSLGAGVTIGAEWFVRQRISLSAEYPTALTATIVSNPSPDDWAVRLAQDGVRFGVSVYFP